MTLALKHALPIVLLFSLLLGSCASPPPAPVPPPTPAVAALPVPPLWTDAERAAYVTFWNRPGRMQVSFAPPRATLTPEASVWFSAFNRARRTASPCGHRRLECLDGCQIRP